MHSKKERHSWDLRKDRVMKARCLPAGMITAVLLLHVVFFSACKRAEFPDPEVVQRSQAELIKDSVFYYYTRYSLWAGMLDQHANADYVFSDSHQTPQDVLDALKRATPYLPAYGGSIDRFSYIKNTDASGLQAEGPNEPGSGFGLFISIGAVTNERAYPVIYFVEGGSPAARAGLKRSDIVLSVNGSKDLGIPVSCGSQGCHIIDETRYQQVINILLEAMDLAEMDIEVRRSNQSRASIQINSQLYQVDPVISDQVFAFPQKRVGYLALSSFEDISPGSGFREKLDRVFESFEHSGVQDLILDLRYNTGGYVQAAEYLANKIISPAGEGALMYSYVVNDYLQKHPGAVDFHFQEVRFDRSNNLRLNSVYVLVSDITASASELLINVLRPYMHVVLVAEHEGTYGKPVGFFKQEIMDELVLWAASFKLVNARGETDYWDGIGADIRNVTDDIFRDFGDPEELMTATAIRHSRGGGTIKALRVPRRSAGKIISASRVNQIPPRMMIH